MDGATREAGVRCVLWHAPGKPVPDALLSALSRRGIGFVARSSACRAMAEACALSLEWPGDRCVLLMVEPNGLPGSSEVRSLLEAGRHRVATWVYEDAAPVQLRAANASAGAGAARVEAAFDAASPAPKGEPLAVVITPGLRERLGMAAGPSGAPSTGEHRPLGLSEGRPTRDAKPAGAANGHAPIAAKPAPRRPEANGEHEDSGLLSREELDILLGREEGREGTR